MIITHLNKNNNPRIVDISEKKTSKRFAHAISKVVMPKNIMKHFIKNDFIGKKGSVFNTAIISGIMAAKKVYEIIPLCHNIIIDYCKIKINISEDNEIWINCIVKTNNKTGVEIEALLGASIAALTIYDMCKSMSKNIIIKETKLLKKTGGKSDF